MTALAQKKLWYKDAMVWFIIAWPLIAIIAGTYTFYLAYSTDDGLVVDDYYKKGKTINQVIARDQAATVFGLTARVVQNSDNQSIMLYLTANNSAFVLPEQLKFSYLHPTLDKLDQHLVLQHKGNGAYAGNIKNLHDGRWYVYLETDGWRLNTEITMPKNQSYTLSAN